MYAERVKYLQSFECKKKNSGNVHINVTLRCIHETIVAEGKQ